MVIVHFLHHLLIEKEHFELGYDGKVLKPFSRFSEFLEPWFLTLGKWTSGVFFPRASIATAAVYAATNVLWVEARQSRDLLLDFEQQLKVPEVFQECTAQGFVSIPGESIVDIVIEGADIGVINII